MNAAGWFYFSSVGCLTPEGLTLRFKGVGASRASLELDPKLILNQLQSLRDTPNLLEWRLVTEFSLQMVAGNILDRLSQLMVASQDVTMARDIELQMQIEERKLALGDQHSLKKKAQFHKI